MSKRKDMGVVPAPIWAHPPPGGRRPKLTREQISDTALAIADAEGFEAVSMRRVADELGVATMTLYYYVRTKDDLLALMDDALTGEILLPPGKLPKHWRQAITAIARASRDVFVKHPWALSWREGTKIGPNGMMHMEQSLASLADSPLDARGKIELIAAVDDYVFGHVLRLRDPLATSSDTTTVRAVDEFIGAQLASGNYPHLAAMVGRDRPVTAFMRFAAVMTDDGRFERGLVALLDGFDKPRPKWNARRPR